MKKIYTYLILFTILFSFFYINISNIEARSGCCSHHSGVKSNGCGCNDGTPLSATCAPYYSCTAITYHPKPIVPSEDPVKPTPISVNPKIVSPEIPVINTAKTQSTTPTPTVKATPRPIVKPTPEIKPIVGPVVEQSQKQNAVISTPKTEIKKPGLLKRFFNWLF